MNAFGKAVAGVLLACQVSAGVAATLSFAKPAVVPVPERLSYKDDVEVRLDAAQTMRVRCPDAAASGWVRDHVRLWFGVEPKVIAETVAVETAEEGYRLKAEPAGIILEAKTLQGIRYAMYTLRQVAERDSSGYKVTYYRLPELTVEDSPRLNFRGLHLCWFPEQSASYIERAIRTAAAYKFNCVVLENWGVFQSERHPWFGWPNGPMTKAAIRRLVDIARDAGIVLVPQINVFGHASASRSCTGKHAALEFHPEMQSLFEPGGGKGGSTSSAWNWCLSNPAAVETVKDLVVELHEAFGNPPYFHIGCDEADPPSCANCRAVDYTRLVADYITDIGKLLAARGARAMMWHDMLLRSGDPRWKGFYANGDEALSKLPQMLPKDLVVCDWYYGSDPGGTQDPKSRTSLMGQYPTLDYFAKTCGFDTLTCPWEQPDGIRAQAKYAADTRLFGVLETTWHHFGGTRFPQMVQISACGAWGRGEWLCNGHFATVWRQCAWDAKSPSYRESGWYDTQVSRDILGR